jgi:hypothetical protein
MPSLLQFDLPIPPLPSHYPPHAIYKFCAALRSLMLQIQPRMNLAEDGKSERWGLLQRVNTNGHVGEWWTGAADPGSVEESLVKLEGVEGSLLEHLAGKGDQFGESVHLGTAEGCRVCNPRVNAISPRQRTTGCTDPVRLHVQESKPETAKVEGDTSSAETRRVWGYTKAW